MPGQPKQKAENMHYEVRSKTHKGSGGNWYGHRYGTVGEALRAIYIDGGDTALSHGRDYFRRNIEVEHRATHVANHLEIVSVEETEVPLRRRVVAIDGAPGLRFALYLGDIEAYATKEFFEGGSEDCTDGPDPSDPEIAMFDSQNDLLHALVESRDNIYSNDAHIVAMVETPARTERKETVVS